MPEDLSASNPPHTQRGEIPPPGVSKDLLGQLLYAGSEEQFRQLLMEYPELQRYAEIGFPMHEALDTLLMHTGNSDLAGDWERVTLITEMRPGVSYVVTETGTGNRIVNFYEIPAETLSALMLVTPDRLQLHIIQTLQVSLHHPEYLTAECYWMLGEMVTSPRSSPELQLELKPLHTALGICLEYGFSREWTTKIRSESDALE